jgi:thiamine biosynthesis lipoprotein
MPRLLLPPFGVLLASLVALPAAEAAGSAPAGRAGVERGLVLMGTRAELRVEAVDRATALAASEAAVRALEAAEARLSTWAPPGGGDGAPSELVRLNRAPVGEPVALSPALADELRRADACRRRTGGAFDPGIGALVAAWGLRTGGRVPGPAELAGARSAGGEALELREDGTAVRRAAGLVLEEGGFGKGAGLDAALAALAAAPGVLAAEIDLGGQVAVYRTAGPTTSRDRRTPAAVALADPVERHRAVARLEIDGGSVATSGNGERGLTVDGRRIGHLLDPRTGRPAPDFGSLTVWAPRALEADCLATGLYALGPEAALAWAEEHPEIEAAIARRSAGHPTGHPDSGAADRVEITITSGFAGRVAPLREGVRIGVLDSPPADAGMKAGAGAGRSVSPEVPDPRSPKDRGWRVTARSHEPGADGSPRL